MLNQNAKPIDRGRNALYRQPRLFKEYSWNRK
jgi:hypothetical protein